MPLCRQSVIYARDGVELPRSLLATGLAPAATCLRDDRPAGSATPPAVWFAYTPDRKSIHPQEHLFLASVRQIMS